MQKVKICIQNGHNTNALPQGNPLKPQTGTSGERDLIEKVFYAVKTIIDKDYSQIIALYYDDARCLNAPNMDYFLAPHFDGSTNKSYEGGFVDCNPSSTTKEKDWEFARLLADNYFNEMGIRFAPEHRTVNSTYYYGFSYTGENTIQTLIELGTLTNDSDRAKCQDHGKIARLLVKGVIAYLAKYDTNYQEYIKSQNADNCKAQVGILQQKVEDLTRSLETTKKEYLDFQTNQMQKLAKEVTLRQSWENKYNTLVENIRKLFV